MFRSQTNTLSNGALKKYLIIFLFSIPAKKRSSSSSLNESDLTNLVALQHCLADSQIYITTTVGDAFGTPCCASGSPNAVCPLSYQLSVVLLAEAQTQK